MIYLVSCVSQKLEKPAPARELYCSDWFLKARNYVEATGQPWFILSARYGLVLPDQVIEPYDLSLNSLPQAKRQRWAFKVGFTLHQHLGDLKGVDFTILAGAAYRESLARWVPMEAQTPMAGLALGEQKRWLLNQLAALQVVA